MGEDASDLIQFAAPRALGILVRIILMERTSENFICLDNGPTGRVIRDSTKKTKNKSLETVTQKVVSMHGENPIEEPSVFLLFKPGHYDILVPYDDED